VVYCYLDDFAVWCRRCLGLPAADQHPTR